MNSNLQSPDPPPDEIEKSDDETEKEPTPQITDANTNQSKDIPPSLQNNHEELRKTQKVKNLILTLKKKRQTTS